MGNFNDKKYFVAQVTSYGSENRVRVEGEPIIAFDIVTNNRINCHNAKKPSRVVFIYFLSVFVSFIETTCVRDGQRE